MEIGVKLSIIIPVYNEAENLPLLMQALSSALNPLAITWEVIFVDDGSKDNSAAVLEKLADENPASTRVVILRRNFGQTTAIAAGIDHSQGDVIVLMDADLQNDPADIPMLLAKLDEGYDVVSGWRANRQDTF
jgi:glycosyltransferase involved in cell wall biosynthesis